MNKLTIRQARPGDAAAISALIVPLLPLLTLESSGAGAEKFIETNSRRRSLADYAALIRPT